MPNVLTKLKVAEKQAWVAYCQAQGLSESDLLRKLIFAVIDPKLTPTPKAPKSEQIALRFKPEDFQLMTDRAQQEGFPSRSNWATQVLLTTLHQSPTFTTTEMNTLRDANRELSAIGRNLNQITKVLNSDPEQNQITLEFLHTLAQKIEQHHRQTTALLRKGQQRW